jgi:integrase
MDVELSKFKIYLVNSNRAPASETYVTVLDVFSSWLSAQKKDLRSFSANDVEEYYRNISNANTANMFLAALKSFMRYHIATIDNNNDFLTESRKITQISTIRPRPRRGKREKVALSEDELVALLSQLRAKPRTAHNDLVYSGTILHFYFGARPVELAHWLRTKGVEHPAKIDWKNNRMELWTAKVHFYRVLAWNDVITPHLKRWCNAIESFTSPRKWMTQRIGRYEVNGVHITAKTGRKTVQTQMRLAGVSDFITDTILGHVSNSSAIGDVYTDFELFVPQIEEVMKNKHYMLSERLYPYLKE